MFMQTAKKAGPAPETVELMETLSHGWMLEGLWLTSIVELATVVGCREQGDQLSLRKELVTILNNLVDIRVKIDFLKIRNLFFIPGELCISSRSRVCEGTWQPPSRKSGCQREFQKFSNFSPPLQMWMKRLCHFHPIPLCPKSCKIMAM